MTNHRINGLVVVVVLAISIVTGATAGAAIIDNFSVDSSASYNIVDVYNPGDGAGGAYNITGGQFAPTEGDGNVETYFYRNTGQRFGAAGGDSISIDLDSLGTAGTNVLGFGFGLTPTTSTRTEIGIESGGDTWSSLNLDAGAPTGAIAGLTLSSPATLAVTRETSDDTKFDYSLSGGGLSSPVTGTFTVSAFASQPVYFAILAYESGADDNLLADNLSFTAVPEPASLGGMMLGVWVLLRRRRA